MTLSPIRSRTALGCGLALALAAGIGLAPIAAAQQFLTSPGSFYIDGGTPVDPQTRDLVDAYLQQKKIEDLREAERLEGLELFIYKDRIYTGSSFGRF
jgi:hypothetical protein